MAKWSTNRRMDEQTVVYLMKYYSAVKKKKLLIYEIWMNFKHFAE